VPIETPILEQAALFERSLGDGSDVVQKEMFQLTSLGGERLAMRPEGTASVVRALCQKEGQPRGRVWYHGPMFRYERPQSGRYRQVKRAGLALARSSITVLALARSSITVLALARSSITVLALARSSITVFHHPLSTQLHHRVSSSP
jgi:histidyl-tRNA synthetase